MRFDAILFDAGGVLVVPDPVVLGPVVEPHGGSTDEETLVWAHFAGSHALDAAGGEVEAWDDYLRGFVRAAGVADRAVDAAAEELRGVLVDAHWRHPMPGAIDALRALHNRGVPLGVVSNAAGQIEATLVEQAICQVGAGAGVPMVAVVDSHVVGVRKPEAGVFLPAIEALSALGVADPARVAYVGDTVFNDVRGATAAGLVPLLHDPLGLHAGGPHETIASLGELVDWAA